MVGGLLKTGYFFSGALTKITRLSTRVHKGVLDIQFFYSFRMAEPNFLCPLEDQKDLQKMMMKYTMTRSRRITSGQSIGLRLLEFSFQGNLR